MCDLPRTLKKDLYFVLSMTGRGQHQQGCWLISIVNFLDHQFSGNCILDSVTFAEKELLILLHLFLAILLTSVGSSLLLSL